MSLSLNKLEKMLSKSGIMSTKYFTMGGMCVYIETLILETADVLLIYIPSKYEIPAPRSGNVFKISTVEVNEDGTIPGDYGMVDNIEIENQYEQVDLGIDKNGAKVEEQLENNYNQPLSLKDLSGKDMSQLREVFRQLKRLKLCVQTLKYKLCITFNNYLSCIRRDDTFEGFVINGPPSSSELKLRVSIDLESLYAKRGSIAIDVKTIREGIYRVLDKNQVRHTNNLQKILDHKMDFMISSTISREKKLKYTTYLARLDNMLQNLVSAESKEKDSIELIHQRYGSETSVKGLHNDITKSHLIAKHQEKITSINVTRQDVIRNTLKVKGELENLSLRLDKICFDNVVMLDAILRNFIDMAEF